MDAAVAHVVMGIAIGALAGFALGIGVTLMLSRAAERSVSQFEL